MEELAQSNHDWIAEQKLWMVSADGQECTKITLAIGDRIRFTKNVKHRGQKFLNNELRTVVSIDDGKITFDKRIMYLPIY